MLIDFKDREREGEKHWHERETSISFLSYTPPDPDHPNLGPIWDWTRNLGMGPDEESNQWPFSLRDGAPSNWATVARAWSIDFDQCAETTKWGKDSLQQMVLEELVIYVQKTEVGWLADTINKT